MSQHFSRYCLFCLSWSGKLLLASVIFFCLVLLILRHWILPDIEKYHTDIVAAITRVAEQPIQIKTLRADWRGLRPRLSMQGVSIYDQQARLALVLPSIEGAISWRSLLHGELIFHDIVIDQPALVMRRDAEGLLHVAGMTLSGEQQESGFFDWLLRQRHLLIKRAFIFWQDDLRHKAIQYFESVNLRLQNKEGGDRHQFGLRAKSSSPLFSKIDVRGDLTGDSLQTLSTWQGRMFAQLQDFDLQHWQEWLILPTDVVLTRGQGSVRAWMDIETGDIASWVADMNLQAATLRFAQQPPLSIRHLRGRSGWNRKEDDTGVEEQWFVRNLRLALNKQPSQRSFTPITAAWHVYHRKDHQPAEYRLQVDQLDLGMLTQLAAYLPLASTQYDFLANLSPRGLIKHADFEWQANWDKTPVFKARATFNDFAVQSFGAYPAIEGASGVVSITEKGGSVFLSSNGMTLYDAPQLTEKLVFHMLVGRVDWINAHADAAFQLRLNHVVFASNVGNGALQGHYALKQDSPAQIDLTGRLSQADLPLLSQYANQLFENSTTQKISETLLVGRLRDTEFRLQGELEHHSDNDNLSIHIETDIDQTAIRISDDWPVVTDVAGHISVQNEIFGVDLASAKVAGLNFQMLSLQTNNLYAEQPEIKIKGLAHSDGKEVMHLLRKVDINPHTNEFLNQTKLFGQGHLQFDTALLLTAEGLSVANLQGAYQFINNRIDFDPYVPDFYQLNGTLAFTDAGITLKNAHAQLLGGPIEIASNVSSTGETHIVGKGQVDFDHFKTVNKALANPAKLSSLWTQFAHGSTDWQFDIGIGHDRSDIVIESSLKGVELLFPAPFAKIAVKKLPFRLERSFIQPHDDHIRLHYGDIVNAEFQRRHEKIHFYHPMRGVVHFGGKSKLPRAQNTQVKGSVSKLEWDQWRELFQRHAEISATIDPAARGLSNILTSSMQFDLKIDQFEFLSSLFNQAQLVVDKREDLWKIQAASREVTGDITWHAALPQRITARLSKFILPQAASESVLLARAPHAPGNWPALDIEADELFKDEVLLGQMKMSAVQQANGWRVENLDIRHSDSRLLMDGLWENHRPPYRVLSRVQLQSNNIGKFFKRYGYPDRVARGEGVLAGELRWVGRPFSIDFPTLSGKLQLSAQYGQFTELKPGIGRLLGVFDLKSLPRRLTLNFYDIFGEGFSFDRVDGLMLIDDGVVATDNLHIAGSSAELALSGKWNLVDETQALNLKVYPSFGLVTPIAGLAAMVTSGTLQDPFNRVLFNEYMITGSWSDPVVVKLDQEEDQTERPKAEQSSP
ncbi:hypothetical protein Nstercoris_01813 [Nitrosomonas stercoris]|uniref:YhdP central domain-containing protein n=1 Tax=Nitrosomonas stercoris TaxID=1444684 RepID=A0A4Y1YN02_9PROT|nr:hypothetical protein Nstercoris_01813 [Nitrosomonas stercoris]